MKSVVVFTSSPTSAQNIIHPFKVTKSLLNIKNKSKFKNCSEVFTARQSLGGKALPSPGFCFSQELFLLPLISTGSSVPGACWVLVIPGERHPGDPGQQILSGRSCLTPGVIRANTGMWRGDERQMLFPVIPQEGLFQVFPCFVQINLSLPSHRHPGAAGKGEGKQQINKQQTDK